MTEYNNQFELTEEDKNYINSLEGTEDIPEELWDKIDYSARVKLLKSKTIDDTSRQKCITEMKEIEDKYKSKKV